MTDWQLIIFDCDGVLVDSEGINCQVYAEIASELGWPIGFEEAIRTFKGHTNAQINEMIESHIGYEVAGGTLPIFLERVTKHYERDLLAIPGIMTVLNALSVPFCVASNGDPVETEMKLRFTGLSSWFTDRQFSAAELGKPKPDPAVFLEAADHFAADPAQCLVIEDGVHGVEGALAAGMRVVGLVATPFTDENKLRAAGAEDVLHDPREILTFLTR